MKQIAMLITAVLCLFPSGTPAQRTVPLPKPFTQTEAKSFLNDFETWFEACDRFRRAAFLAYPHMETWRPADTEAHDALLISTGDSVKTSPLVKVFPAPGSLGQFQNLQVWTAILEMRYELASLNTSLAIAEGSESVELFGRGRKLELESDKIRDRFFQHLYGTAPWNKKDGDVVLGK